MVTTQRPRGPEEPSAGGQAPALTARDVLAGYLHTQAAEFLRSLRLHRESGAEAGEAVEAARQLRRSARRISGALHTFRPLTDTAWSDPLCAELVWLSGVLAREHAYAARLARLRGALHRLSGADSVAGATGAAPGRTSADGYDQQEYAARARLEEAVCAAERVPKGGGESDARSAQDGQDGQARQDRRNARDVRSTRDAQSARDRDREPRAARSRESAQRVADGAARASSPLPGAVGATEGEPGRDTTTGSPADSGSVTRPAEGSGPAAGAATTSPGGALTVGAARAGALLERQLTLARTRAHSAALQALGSSRFHAVADAVAVLASEAPLDPKTADGPAEEVLGPLAEQVHRRLEEAVDGLPLGRAGYPYNAEALVHGLAATAAADAPPAAEQQDAPWHQVRLLVRLRRYAQEVLDAAAADGPAGDEPTLSVRLYSVAQALERHRDAAEAAAAAASAARTPRIAPATAYALGVLHADQRHDVEAARFAFGRLWQRIAVNA
ncbi:CHAD domain-containing protein [Streptomyces sp. NPDC004647]|uniref:CHAD domain-containing protein n=1 Tax=Streptomyces sp. NPDC004647 TaxID=3154671 RepID=UPI0033B9A1BC